MGHGFKTVRKRVGVWAWCATFALSALWVGGACAEAVEPAGSDAEVIAAAAERLRQRDAAMQSAARPPLTPTTPASPVVMDPMERQPLGQPGDEPALTTATESLLIGPEDAKGTGSGWMLNTMTALGVVLGIVLLIRWGYAKLGGKVVGRGGAGATAVVEVLSRSMIAPRNHVLLLRVGGRVLVVSDSSAGTRTLCEVTDPVEVADLMQAVEASKPTSVTGGFGKVLSGVSAGYEPDVSETGGDEGEHRVDRVRDLVSGLQAKLRFVSGGSTSKGGVA
ncbi:MAG: flagellar biosynthetic protein FliO [Planctomycetota bacterium]